jgi:hypothetical protein
MAVRYTIVESIHWVQGFSVVVASIHLDVYPQRVGHSWDGYVRYKSTYFIVIVGVVVVAGTR